jgi:hypothetical protein
MQNLIVLEANLENFFITKVIKHGVSILTLTPNDVDDILLRQLPEFSQRVFDIKRIRFTDKTQSSEALRDIVMTMSFGLEHKTECDFDKALKLLLHRDGGIEWCYKKGNTEIVNLRQRVMDLKKRAIILKNNLPLKDVTPGSELSLLDRNFSNTVDDILRSSRPLWLIGYPNKNSTDIYSLEMHQKILKELAYAERYVTFLRSFDLDAFFNVNMVRSYNLFGLAVDTFILISSSMMIHLALSDFKKVGFMVDLDILDAFRSKWCDYQSGTYYLKNEVVEYWIEWLHKHCLAKQLSSQVIEEAIERWMKIAEYIASALSQPIYQVTGYAEPGNINTVFPLKYDFDLFDKRVVTSDMIKNAVGEDLDYHSLIDAYDSVLEEEFSNLNEQEKMGRIKKDSSFTLSRIFYQIAEERGGLTGGYTETAYYLNSMNADKATDVFLNMEILGIQITSNERAGIPLMPIRKPEEIYQDWTWTDRTKADFNDPHVSNIFPHLNKDLQLKIMETLKKRAN